MHAQNCLLPVFYIFLVVQFIITDVTAATQPRLIGTIPAPNPGYVTVVGTKNNTECDLYISSFSGVPFSTDHVFRVKDILRNFQSLSSTRAEVVTSRIVWPNEIDVVPGNT